MTAAQATTPEAAAVIDASVAIAALSPDEASEAARAIIDGCLERGAHVPPNWPLEVTNVLLVKQRRRIIDMALADQAMDAILGIRARIEDPADEAALKRAKKLAERHGLASYDAAYLELAMRRSLPLATLDARLAEAARHEGVRVLEAGEPA